MSAAVRTFFRRLGDDALADVFSMLEVDVPPLAGLPPTKRASTAAEAAIQGEWRRGQIEAIVSEIATLTDKPDLAELALRAVCEKDADLLAILDESLSLEERCWKVWRQDAKLIDRARNVAMGHHWRDGRFHSGFLVSNPGGLRPDLSKAVESIQTYIQTREGGRRVDPDTFTYREAQTDGVDHPGLVHHVAIYLERPARYLLEFGDGDDGVQPIIRHEARELAVSYNERTGRIDVAGYGIGGQAVLKDIAATFHSEAVNNSELGNISRQDWRFDTFLTTRDPPLSPPEGFASACVTELKLRAKDNPTHRATFKTDAGSSAYARMRDFGVTPLAVTGELVAGVVLMLKTFPDPTAKPRDVRVILDWPASLKVDNATMQEQDAIKAWLEMQTFAARTS